MTEFTTSLRIPQIIGQTEALSLYVHSRYPTLSVAEQAM